MDDEQGSPTPAGMDVTNSPGRPNPTGWERIVEFYKDSDRNMADGFKNDIDTQLVLAGLFLAALAAAFIIQSNILLRVDNSRITADLLRELATDSKNNQDLLAQMVALQMGLLSAVLSGSVLQSNTSLQVHDSDLLAQLTWMTLRTGNSFNQSAVQSPPFASSSPSVVVNTLWYLSLVLGLALALF